MCAAREGVRNGAGLSCRLYPSPVTHKNQWQLTIVDPQQVQRKAALRQRRPAAAAAAAAAAPQRLGDGLALVVAAAAAPAAAAAAAAAPERRQLGDEEARQALLLLAAAAAVRPAAARRDADHAGARLERRRRLEVGRLEAVPFRVGGDRGPLLRRQLAALDLDGLLSRGVMGRLGM